MGPAWPRFLVSTARYDPLLIFDVVHFRYILVASLQDDRILSHNHKNHNTLHKGNSNLCGILSHRCHLTPKSNKPTHTHRRQKKLQNYFSLQTSSTKQLHRRGKYPQHNFQGWNIPSPPSKRHLQVVPLCHTLERDRLRDPTSHYLPVQTLQHVIG